MDLPTEIVTEILGYLDYKTLHNGVRPTCRWFNDIVMFAKSGPLPENLFISNQVRSETSTSSKKQKWDDFADLETHPCFESLRADFKILQYRPLSIEDIGFYKVSDRYPGYSGISVFIPLTKTTVANENATSPAFSVVEMYRLMGRDGWETTAIYNSETEAVTVLDVVTAFIAIANLEWSLGIKQQAYHRDYDQPSDANNGPDKASTKRIEVLADFFCLYKFNPMSWEESTGCEGKYNIFWTREMKK